MPNTSLAEAVAVMGRRSGRRIGRAGRTHTRRARRPCATPTSFPIRRRRLADRPSHDTRVRPVRLPSERVGDGPSRLVLRFAWPCQRAVRWLGAARPARRDRELADGRHRRPFNRSPRGRTHRYAPRATGSLDLTLSAAGRASGRPDTATPSIERSVERSATEIQTQRRSLTKAWFCSAIGKRAKHPPAANPLCSKDLCLEAS